MTDQAPWDVWHSLLPAVLEQHPDLCASLTRRMRDARLTFGDRVHCPFLRPFFLTPEDEDRVRRVAERIASMGERFVKAAFQDNSLFRQVALREEEEHLARIDPRYGTASTASRLDAFLLPDSLQFAEYNAESPAGAGYSETLAEIFATLPVMERFKERFDVRSHPLMRRLLDALIESYREWGGHEPAPVIAIVDWREVPTWEEFNIIQERFERHGVPTFVCDPRDLTFDGKALSAKGRRIDLVYRRVLINDIVTRPKECAALVRAYEAGVVCVANTFRCKIPHKKAFFAALTDDRNAGLFDDGDREVIRQHVPWTRLLREDRTERWGTEIDLLRYVRLEREHLVIKPNDEYGGVGVVLGWEASASEWDDAIQRAVADEQAWIVQDRITVRREDFPGFDESSAVSMRNMLIDFAPYLFRGRLAGFLTRLSSTGLANVTSGGGQVPSFVVKERAS